MSPDERTEELCIAALERQPTLLGGLRPQTHDMCECAVLGDSWMIQYVENQTPELCLMAVMQNGLSIQYVRDKTPEICLAAVQQNAWALEYIEQQTLDLVVSAVERNTYALMYARLPFGSLADPVSGELEAWIHVLRATRETSKPAEMRVLEYLVRAIPVGKQHSNEWSQPMGDGRLWIDSLIELSKELYRLAPRNRKVITLNESVRKQVQMTLEDMQVKDTLSSNADECFHESSL